jgi:FkbM family methyltransferase
MKELIQRVFHFFGYEMKKFKKNQAEIDLVRNIKWLSERNISSIIDIGANAGQFAKLARLSFPLAKIYSFEPIPSVFEKLKENFADDTNFEAFNTALGEENGEVTFFQNDYTLSSSCLKMKDAHKIAAPHTVNATEIKVRMATLDEVLHSEEIKSPYLIKIDVQGLEDKVINGGQHIIRHADYIITEVSFVELYENQPLFDVIYHKLSGMGFRYIGSFEQMLSPLNSEILQADAIFAKIK